MKVACSSYPISKHESFESWQKHIEKWVFDAVKNKANILVFPEYGSMELVSVFPLEIQENLKNQLVELQILLPDFKACFKELASRFDVTIVAPSFPVLKNDKFINRAFVFGANGNEGFQDKFMMTPFERFEWGIDSSEKVLTVFETKKGNFGIQICYDSEFAIGSRELCKAGADVIVMPSCTETLRGATRVHIGARSRALENQCYTMVSQTVGLAPWSPAVDINYGYVGAYSTPDGNFPEEGIYFQSEHNQAGWFYQEFDFSQLNVVRENGGVRNFEDHKKIQFKFESEAIEIRKIKLN